MTRNKVKALKKFSESIEGCYSAEAESAMMTGWLAGWEDREAEECQSEKSEVEKSSGGASVENLKRELGSLNAQLNSIQNEVLINYQKVRDIGDQLELLVPERN